MRVFIGLGSNLGDRLDHVRGAVSSLRESELIEVVALSSIYETKPVGPTQPDFLNAVAEISTSLSARELLDVLKSIEAAGGRVDRERWGPREIDLDLLLYGDAVIDEPDLKVPHPQLHNRAFVLVPLAELDPSLAGGIEVDPAGVALYEHTF